MAHMATKIQIAVGFDENGWHEIFAKTLSKRIEQGLSAEYRLLNLGHNNWIDMLNTIDLVLWKPSFFGPRSASFFKEKVYFIETYLNKLIIPNFNTIWHFESKIAQSYLFKKYSIPSPHTVVSFDFHNAAEELDLATMPIVVKKSYGASSNNVTLVSKRTDAEHLLSKTFSRQLWDEAKLVQKSKVVSFLTSITKPWIWSKIRNKILGEERYEVIYWQEFVANNTADLRITVIGNRYAFGFWRNNRPNDFRASGSGRIDFNRHIPLDVLLYCLKISNKFNFDSMAYDILFTDDGFVITEMSYGYVASVLQRTKGYYELSENDKLVFHEGHIWPQELWVDWALERATRKFGCYERS